MTLSGVFHSVLSGTKLHAADRSRASSAGDSGSAAAAAEREVLRRCEVLRRTFRVAQIALPAEVLKDRLVAKWVRDRGLPVDVHTGGELAVAIAAGIHPAMLTVHADVLSSTDLRAAVHLGAGRVVVSSIEQIDAVASATEQRMQGLVIRLTDANSPALDDVGDGVCIPCGFRFDTAETDAAIRLILDQRRLNLVGLHCDVGSQVHDFVSYPAAIGQMIAKLTHVRRTHAIVLSRLGLGGGGAALSGDWSVDLADVAAQIDESLDDACATLRYPRPHLVLSTNLATVEKSAA